MAREARVPGWGVVAVCVMLAVWLAACAATSAALTVPRRIVRRPRLFYRGSHAGRVSA